ncbi:hypothetical protein DFH11DRAFT_1589812 [Phellopilus nigrolimitatus]|nr:hypothetical protein DFH11DRAFT_1589812 [Phellopilus nigrolimitatus]
MCARRDSIASTTGLVRSLFTMRIVLGGSRRGPTMGLGPAPALALALVLAFTCGLLREAGCDERKYVENRFEFDKGRSRILKLVDERRRHRATALDRPRRADIEHRRR